MLAAAGAEPGTRRNAAGSPRNLRTALRGSGATEAPRALGMFLLSSPKPDTPSPEELP